uniref:NADH-ubiquinone oxidoreductase chain 3 n=1 Tax=Saccopharynx lavenbergi TaxID=136490 RepID=Q76MH3_9TELE|nr:NADH dehydrogenase subunits 3 [Saccopharynx lavenbergi]
MYQVILILIISAALAFLIISASLWMPQMHPATEKLSPYECGFDPMGSARLPFSIHFFVVAILFLLFDLEIALLLPLPWMAELPDTLNSFFWATLIVILVTLGFAYEWVKGGLEWAE